MAGSRSGAATLEVAMVDREASLAGGAAREDRLAFREEVASRVAEARLVDTAALVDLLGEAADPPGTLGHLAEVDTRRVAFPIDFLPG